MHERAPTLTKIKTALKITGVRSPYKTNVTVRKGCSNTQHFQFTFFKLALVKEYER